MESINKLNNDQTITFRIIVNVILTPKNDDVKKLNDIIINQFSIEEQNLLSFDRDTHNWYLQEFLNSIDQGSLPTHILKVKRGAPFMLVRNINPNYGVWNDTRLLCRGIFRNMFYVKILIGNNVGTRVSFQWLN